MRMFMSACSPEEPGIVVLTTWVFVLEYTKRVVCASWLNMYVCMYFRNCLYHMGPPNIVCSEYRKLFHWGVNLRDVNLSTHHNVAPRF
jgi:hypothetical protein